MADSQPKSPKETELERIARQAREFRESEAKRIAAEKEEARLLYEKQKQDELDRVKASSGQYLEETAREREQLRSPTMKLHDPFLSSDTSANVSKKAKRLSEKEKAEKQRQEEAKITKEKNRNNKSRRKFGLFGRKKKQSSSIGDDEDGDDGTQEASNEGEDDGREQAQEQLQQQSLQKSQGSLRLSIPTDDDDYGDDDEEGDDGFNSLSSPNSSFMRRSQGSLRLNVPADDEESKSRSSNSSLRKSQGSLRLIVPQDNNDIVEEDEEESSDTDKLSSNSSLRKSQGSLRLNIPKDDDERSNGNFVRPGMDHSSTLQKSQGSLRLSIPEEEEATEEQDSATAGNSNLQTSQGSVRLMIQQDGQDIADDNKPSEEEEGLEEGERPNDKDSMLRKSQGSIRLNISTGGQDNEPSNIIERPQGGVDVVIDEEVKEVKSTQPSDEGPRSLATTKNETTNVQEKATSDDDKKSKSTMSETIRPPDDVTTQPPEQQRLNSSHVEETPPVPVQSQPSLDMNKKSSSVSKNDELVDVGTSVTKLSNADISVTESSESAVHSVDDRGLEIPTDKSALPDAKTKDKQSTVTKKLIDNTITEKTASRSKSSFGTGDGLAEETIPSGMSSKDVSKTDTTAEDKEDYSPGKDQYQNEADVVAVATAAAASSTSARDYHSKPRRTTRSSNVQIRSREIPGLGGPSRDGGPSSGYPHRSFGSTAVQRYSVRRRSSVLDKSKIDEVAAGSGQYEAFFHGRPKKQATYEQPIELTDSGVLISRDAELVMGTYIPPSRVKGKVGAMLEGQAQLADTSKATGSFTLEYKSSPWSRITCGMILGHELFYPLITLGGSLIRQSSSVGITFYHNASFLHSMFLDHFMYSISFRHKFSSTSSWIVSSELSRRQELSVALSNEKVEGSVQVSLRQPNNTTMSLDVRPKLSSHRNLHLFCRMNTTGTTTTTNTSFWQVGGTLVQSLHSPVASIGLGIRFISTRGLEWILSWNRGTSVVKIPMVISRGYHSMQFSQALYLSMISFLIQECLAELWGWKALSSESKINDGDGTDAVGTDYDNNYTVDAKNSREDAELQREIMSRQAKRKVREETEKNGLVIQKAIYQVNNTDSNKDGNDDDDVDDGKWDATIPLQFWVTQSTLILPATSKSRLLGFYDVVAASKNRSKSRNKNNKRNKDDDYGQPSSWWNEMWNDLLDLKKIDGYGGTGDSSSSSTATKRGRVPIATLSIEFEYKGQAYTISINDDEELKLPSNKATPV